MNFDNLISSKNRLASLLVISFLLFIISIIPGFLNDWLNNAFLDIQFKLRGSRMLPDDILFVFIGQEDTEQLGDWPISRDYYGYLTHVLSQSNAKVIAFDILFLKSEKHYNEFDHMFVKFMENAGNICLPLAFEELIIEKVNSNQHNHLYTGSKPAFPFPEARRAAAGLGFSNFGKETVVRKVPIVATYGDTSFSSFGTELARMFLGVKFHLRTSDQTVHFVDQAGNINKIQLDKNGNLKLNHFGKISHIHSTSFIDLLKSKDDSLDLSGKMIIVGVTVPGVTILKATPLSQTFPATLIHATVAENIINQNYLRDIPKVFYYLIFIILPFIALGIWQYIPKNFRILATLSFLLIYWFISILIFKYLHYIMPLFYPSLVFLFAYLFLYLTERKQHLLKHVYIKHLLEDQVAQKEAKLKEAKDKLLEYQEMLVDKDKKSEELLQLATERKKAILQLENELRDLQVYLIPQKPHSLEEFNDIIHSPDSRMKEVLELVNRIRTDDIPVLIIGETGSGKELIARAIHKTSLRSNKPFIAINCGSLTETLLESELFGHEKGSFTGAHTRRKGRFELGNGGTIFLDEITETSPSFQAKLLRVLQENSFERVGGEETILVNVRMIAASNRDLQTEIDQGTFRSDLFYRLNGFPIRIPPLRERVEDIPFLAHYFLQKYDYKPVEKFSDQTIEAFKTYQWPGNVRELENIVRRAAILAKSDNRDLIRLTDLAEEIINSLSSIDPEQIYHSFESQILETLRSYKFSHSAISQTAKVLGNRDRGTITEHLRGLCFRELVNSNFDIKSTAITISASNDLTVIERVEKKINEYIKNLHPLPDITTIDNSKLTTLPQFKGLPQKYYPFLSQVIQYLKKQQS